MRIDYTFADLYEADTIAAEYKDMMSYIEDDEMYSNISFSEPKTITVGTNKVSYVCLSYTYGAAKSESENGTNPQGSPESENGAQSQGSAKSENGTNPESSADAENSATGEPCAEYLTWTENNGILFTVQINGLAAPDDALVKEIYENITFK